MSEETNRITSSELLLAPRRDYATWHELRDRMVEFIDRRGNESTIFGMALYLGFGTLDEFYNYKSNDMNFKSLIHGFIEQLDKKHKDFIYSRLNRAKKSIHSSPTPLCKKLKANLFSQLNNATKNRRPKNKYFYERFGYFPQDLVEHLESKFWKDMTWDNYGKEWQIDHIKPVSWFDWSVDIENTIKKCWALDNLQPLPSVLNSMKGNRFEG